MIEPAAAPATEAQSAARTQPWNLRGLSVIAFAHGLSDFYSGIVPFVIFYVVSRAHLSPAYQGALGFLWYLTSSVVQPLFGAYTDRRGRWWFLPCAVLLTIVAVSMSGMAGSVALLGLCIVAGGLGSAIMHPEAGKYSAMLSGTRKAGGISVFQIGGQIGYAMGPAIVAVLLSRFGGSGTMMLLIPGSIAGVALFAAMRGVDRSAHHAHRRSTHALAGSPRAADRTGVALLVTATGLRYFTNAAFMTYLPNVLVARGVSLAGAGQTVSAFLLISAVGLLAGGYLADRFGAVRVSVASLCVTAPFFAGFFLLHGAVAIASLLCAGVLLAVQSAPGVALAQAMLPRNLGMALGLMNGVAFGAGSALVACAGLAVARFGAAPALQVVGWVPLLAAGGFAVAGARPRRPA